MKRNKFILVIVSMFLASGASASDISYSIINSTSTTTNSFSFSVNTIVKRTSYDCELTSYNCLQTKEQVNARLENPLQLVTQEFLDEKEKNKATTTPVAVTQTSVQKKEDLVFGGKVIPTDARFVTYSPDGKKLAYFRSDNAMIKTFKSFVVVFDDGRTLEKFASNGPWELVTDVYRMFGFTSDSNKIVYTDDRDGSSKLYLVDLDKSPKNLTGEALILKKYTVLDFVVSGNSVYFIANRAGLYDWGLYELDLITRKLKTISANVMYTNGLALVNDNIIFTENNKGQGKIKAYNLKENLVKDFSGVSQESVENIPFKIINNKNIRGVLYSPKQGTSVKKAVIWLHGGPYRQTSPYKHSYGSYATFDWMLDELVNSGVTVLKLDYPGSMGQGTAYTNSIVGRIGDVDVKNVSLAVDYVKTLGVKDVYLFGNSYGGYLSIKSLVELNSKLSGAVAVAPVTDWKKLIDDVSPTPFEVHFRGTYSQSNKNLFDKSSIVKNLSKLNKPLFVFHGELDKQVPFSQSEFLYKEALRAGKDIQYYSIKNQAHVINGVSQNEAICSKLVEMLSVSTTTELCVMK